jgi:hypothetical protein
MGMNARELLACNADVPIPARLLPSLELWQCAVDANQPQWKVVELDHEALNQICRVKTGIDQQVMAC